MKDKNKKSNTPTPVLSQKEALRLRLRAKIEANRISRLKRDDQDNILNTYKEKKRRAKGLEKEKLKIMIEVIQEKQRQADEAWENMSYAEYGGGFECGGGGANDGNCAG